MRNWMLSGCAVLLASMLTACPPTTKTKPVIGAFTATPSTVTAAGTDVKLDWTVTDAESISISGSPEPMEYVPAAGVKLTTPTTTAKAVKVNTTFTLTATNTTGVTTKTVDVTLSTSTVGPTIASSVPADAATGVAINSTIAVTFSAAMDKTATLAAFTSASVTTTPASFAWSNGDKTLTITPSALLNTPVATPGTNKTVSYSFAATAKDTAGTALTSTAARTFVTQKAVKATIAGAATLSGNIIFTEGTGVPPACATPCPQNNYDLGIQAGDNNGTAGGTKVSNPNYSYKGFAGFDITTIPATANLVSATVSLTQTAKTGAPYSIITGGLKLQSISSVGLATSFPDTGPGTYDFYTALATKEFVLATDDTAGVKSVVVTTAVAADLASRATFGNRSLFRLMFPSPAVLSPPALPADARDPLKDGAVLANGTEDIARFDTPVLEVVYSQP